MEVWAKKVCFFSFLAKESEHHETATSRPRFWREVLVQKIWKATSVCLVCNLAKSFATCSDYKRRFAVATATKFSRVVVLSCAL